eukprot:6207928-Pleurochrysis_carterae.AAC.1
MRPRHKIVLARKRNNWTCNTLVEAGDEVSHLWASLYGRCGIGGRRHLSRRIGVALHPMHSSASPRSSERL